MKKTSLEAALEVASSMGWAVSILICYPRDKRWSCTLYPATFGKEVWSNYVGGKKVDSYGVVTPRITAAGDTATDAVEAAVTAVLQSPQFVLYDRLERALEARANVKTPFGDCGGGGDGSDSETGGLDGL